MWSEIEAWNLIQNTAVRCHYWVTYSVTQWIVSAGALLTTTQKMFCPCPLHGKLRNRWYMISLTRKRKKIKCLNKTRDWILVKQVVEVLKFLDVTPEWLDNICSAKLLWCWKYNKIKLGWLTSFVIWPWRQWFLKAMMRPSSTFHFSASTTTSRFNFYDVCDFPSN